MLDLNPAKPGVMLAKKLHECPVDPTGWWGSEKMDGVRAYWDGKHLISRQGNIFAAPDWFTECFPNTPLDGELWMGRGTFHETSGIVRRQKPHLGWKMLVYFVFDDPASKAGYEQRQPPLQATIEGANCKYLRHVPSIQIQDRPHLDRLFDIIVSKGGEGVMLVKPGSLYTPTRSACLLKYKKFDDDEGTVVGYVPGKGRHKGRLGALLVRDSAGREFKVGTGFSDDQRNRAEELYPLGTVITFRFFERQKKTGKPREPRFMRVRAEEPGRTGNVIPLRRNVLRRRLLR